MIIVCYFCLKNEYSMCWSKVVMKNLGEDPSLGPTLIPPYLEN
jgi:hypothetical protein